jgi:excisionase family DNA binding protein
MADAPTTAKTNTSTKITSRCVTRAVKKTPTAPLGSDHLTSSEAVWAGVSFGYPEPSLCRAGEVEVEDEKRKHFTVVEAAEYLGLSRTTVQEMVDRGVLEADKFAGAVHIPREEVERLERETAP